MTESSRTRPFTTQENDEVYRRLVSGDATARNEMIEGNIALAVFQTDAYLRLAPQMSYYRDDMISAGLHGLCVAVDRMRNKGPVANPRPTGCITSAITRQIANAVDRSNTIIVPDRVQRRARAEGKPIQPPRVVSEKAAVHVSVFGSEVAAVGLREEIAACCHDDLDKAIVAMRQVGTSDADIAQALAVHKTTVSRRGQAIEDRLLARCSEYKETKRAAAKRAEREAKRKAKREAKKAALANAT